MCVPCQPPGPASGPSHQGRAPRRSRRDARSGRSCGRDWPRRCSGVASRGLGRTDHARRQRRWCPRCGCRRGFGVERDAGRVATSTRRGFGPHRGERVRQFQRRHRLGSVASRGRPARSPTVTYVGPESDEVEPPGTRVVLSGLVGAAALIAAITIAARVIGFGRIVVFARAVGPASCLGNAYFTANTVPNIVFEIVAGGALASLVVPVLAGPAARGSREQTQQTVSALLTWTVLLLTPFAVAGIWLAHPIMSVLVGDSGRCPPDQVVNTGTRMLWVFLPQIVLYGVGIILAGTLQAHRRFAGPALAPLLSSLVVIATYLVFAAVFSGNPNNLADVSRTNELILSVGTTLGVAALTLSLLVPLRRVGMRLRPTLHFPIGVASRI